MIKKLESIKTNSGNDEPQVIDWRISTSCNYNCSYCPVYKESPVTLKNPSKFLKRIKTSLPGKWEFIIIGGEPFLQPNFLEIIQKLIKMGHMISIITNFSASLSQIKEFCRITRGKLNYFGASLHLEQADIDSFLKKAIKVNKIIPRSFSVPSIAKKNNLKKLKKIGEKFARNGIKFRLQTQRVTNNERYIKYSPEEKKIIRQFGRQYGLKKPNFKGKKCWAGCRYFFLDANGDAFRCLPAQKQKKEYLGNILDGTLRLYNKAKPCRYGLCICASPYVRGMIEVKYLNKN